SPSLIILRLLRPQQFKYQSCHGVNTRISPAYHSYRLAFHGKVYCFSAPVNLPRHSRRDDLFAFSQLRYQIKISRVPHYDIRYLYGFLCTWGNVVNTARPSANNVNLAFWLLSRLPFSTNSRHLGRRDGIIANFLLWD